MTQWVCPADALTASGEFRFLFFFQQMGTVLHYDQRHFFSALWLHGFGGFPHLVMAREDVAEVLARRIVEGQMSESQALELARKWFWENQIELYRLEV